VLSFLSQVTCSVYAVAMASAADVARNKYLVNKK